ncbi:hypothetical protein LXL04_028110 [Taraxacum kok-saghyz]
MNFATRVHGFDADPFFGFDYAVFEKNLHARETRKNSKRVDFDVLKWQRKNEVRKIAVMIEIQYRSLSTVMYSVTGEGDYMSSSTSKQPLSSFSFGEIRSELILGKGRSGKVYKGGTGCKKGVPKTEQLRYKSLDLERGFAQIEIVVGGVFRLQKKYEKFFQVIERNGIPSNVQDIDLKPFYALKWYQVLSSLLEVEGSSPTWDIDQRKPTRIFHEHPEFELRKAGKPSPHREFQGKFSPHMAIFRGTHFWASQGLNTGPRPHVGYKSAKKWSNPQTTSLFKRCSKVPPLNTFPILPFPNTTSNANAPIDNERQDCAEVDDASPVPEYMVLSAVATRVVGGDDGGSDYNLRQQWRRRPMTKQQRQQELVTVL